MMAALISELYVASIGSPSAPPKMKSMNCVMIEHGHRWQVSVERFSGSGTFCIGIDSLLEIAMKIALSQINLDPEAVVSEEPDLLAVAEDNFSDLV